MGSTSEDPERDSKAGSGETNADVIARLERAVEDIGKIHALCNVPSISFGVLHQGEIIFRRSIGMRDVEKQLPATPSTLYPLGSVSKTFLSAALGVAADDGKLHWSSTLADFVEGFHPQGDEAIATAEITEFMRHTSGLGCPQVMVIGPNGVLLSGEDREKGIVDLLNEAPTTDAENQQRLGECFQYNNLAYGLVGMALQDAYDMRYSDFLREHILYPLGMHQTATSRSEVSGDAEVAHTYCQVKEGDGFRRLPFQLTDERNTPILAAMGIRSSVNDMLQWAAAILSAESCENVENEENDNEENDNEENDNEENDNEENDSEENDNEENDSEEIDNEENDNEENGNEENGNEDNDKQVNPLRNVSVMRNSYWYLEAPDRFDNECGYGMGWSRVVLPSSMLNWLSFNMKASCEENGKKLIEANILGQDSPSRVAIIHGGAVNGASCAFFTFPETQSAVVAFSNAIQDGDASDFAARILTQALFDLQPRVDLTELVLEERRLRRDEFPRIHDEWLRNQDLEAAAKIPLIDYVGTYFGLGLSISIVADSDDKLSVEFNGHKEAACELERYNADILSFLPTSREEWLEKSMIDWDYYEVGLLAFTRNEKTGVLNGINWKWDEGEHPSWFKKVEG
jgi:CubicO group peptidase (beta-lactamase class C family)